MYQWGALAFVCFTAYLSFYFGSGWSGWAIVIGEPGGGAGV